MGWLDNFRRPSPEGRGRGSMTVSEHNRMVNGEAPGREAPTPLWRKLLVGEQRAVTARDVFGQDGVGTKTNSGTYVNETTAFKFQVVYSAITLIADGVASLPPQAFTEAADGSMEPADLPNWIRKPHPEIRRFDIWNQLLVSVLAWGNGYAQFIRRPSDGVIVGLSVLDPADVTVEWDEYRPGYRKYRIANGPWLTSAEIFHIQGPTLPGQAKGMSVIAQAREAIGLGLTLEEFGARYFGQGSQAKIVIELPGSQVPDESKAKSIVATFERFHRGKGNWHRPALVTGGAKLHNISVPPEDAQFLQSRDFQAATVAGWFRVPPHRVGIVSKSTSWGSGLAEENMAMLQHTFRPWILRMEGALTAYAPGGEDRGLIIKLGDDVLQRGTFKEAADTWSMLVEKGLATPDEGRVKLGLKPMGGEAAKLRDPAAAAQAADPRSQEDDRKRKQDEAAGRSTGGGKKVLESHYSVDSRHGTHNQKDHGRPKKLAVGAGTDKDQADLSPQGQAAVDKFYDDYGTSHEAMVADIESRLTPENIEKFRGWYPEARATTQRMADESDVGHGKISHQQATAVTAIMSPQKAWDEKTANNIEVADYLIKNRHKFDGIPPEKVGSTMVPAQRNMTIKGQKFKKGDMVPLHSHLVASDKDIGSAMKVLRADPNDPNLDAVIDKTITGTKRRSFYNNMQFPNETPDVTVDAWMARAVMNTTRHDHVTLDDVKGGLTDSMKSTEGGSGYFAVAEATRVAASRAGISPAEAQAVYWVAIRNEVNANKSAAMAESKRRSAAKAARLKTGAA